MGDFWHFYQHLPEQIDPLVFRAGFFSLTWYSLMYLVALALVYFLLIYRLKKGEAGYSKDLIFDLLIWLFAGLLIGARLGYVLFYNLPYYLAHPLEAFLPVQLTAAGFQFTGYYGLSYHGGLLGAIIAGYFFCRSRQADFWQLADFIVPAIPAGFFFGRLGNFLNGELYGRTTEKMWGMYFADGLLRHPSQLYEAFFEGLGVFVVLWTLRNNRRFFTGQHLSAYLFLYGFFRFGIEFFREPDAQIGLFFGLLSLGQILCLIMLVSAAAVFVFRRKKLYNTVNTNHYERE